MMKQGNIFESYTYYKPKLKMVTPTQQKLEHGLAVLTTGPWQHAFPVLLAVTKIVHTRSLGKIPSIKKNNIPLQENNLL